MTRSNWLRHALLGSVALGLAATAAQADELANLKAELMLLQNQVNAMQARTPVMPQGASMLSIRKGQGQLSDWAFLRDNGIAPGQGYSFGIVPAADMPAPISEITVAGTIRAQILYRDYDSLYLTGRSLLDKPKGSAIGFDVTGIEHETGKGDADVYSYNNRLSIAGRTDTAIGQVRGALLFDMDNAFGSANLKKAWGEWDTAPGWTLAGGVNSGTSSLEYSPDWYLSTIDVISAAGGPTNSTIEQVRMTYTTGPLSWALAVENSSNGDFVAMGEGQGGANLPDFASRVNYTGNGFAFDIAGAIADDNGNDTDWTIGTSAAVSLAEKTTWLIAANYAEGYYRNFYKSAGDVGVSSIYTAFGTSALHDFAPDAKIWSAGTGLSFGLSEATTMNLAVGYTDFEFEDVGFGTGLPFNADVALTHALANIIYTPVSQFSVGVEVDYARAHVDLAGSTVVLDDNRHADAFGAGVGMWWRF